MRIATLKNTSQIKWFFFLDRDKMKPEIPIWRYKTTKVECIKHPTSIV